MTVGAAGFVEVFMVKSPDKAAEHAEQVPPEKLSEASVYMPGETKPVSNTWLLLIDKGPKDWVVPPLI